MLECVNQLKILRENFRSPRGFPAKTFEFFTSLTHKCLAFSHFFSIEILPEAIENKSTVTRTYFHAILAQFWRLKQNYNFEILLKIFVYVYVLSIAAYDISRAIRQFYIENKKTFSISVYAVCFIGWIFELFWRTLDQWGHLQRFPSFLG